VNPASATFKDVPSDFWAHGTIEALAAQQIVAGVGDGLFAPSQTITCKQLSFLIQKAAPQAYEKAFAATPIDDHLLTRRELSRVLYEVLKHGYAAMSAL